MPNVSIPKSFFVKERRMYASWRFAFWRELFQNATDAGSTEIRVSLADKGGGVIGVEFSDNGSGMTRDVLENVYFSLGSSTKNDGSTVGGFGRARILTCFSMKNYTIHTQNNLVQGDGGTFEIADVDYRKGCLIQVEMENENLSSLRDALREYLFYSQLPCTVFVDNEKWMSWSYRRQLTRTLDLNGVSFASVHVNKSAANNRLLVRVNGTVMYHQYIRAKAQVIVEIEPSMSREVLTANRDGMHNQFAAVLNGFTDEIASDTMNSLTSRLKRKNSTVRGRGLIFSLKPKEGASDEQLKGAEDPLSSSVQSALVQPSSDVVFGQGSFSLLRQSVEYGQRGQAVESVRVAEVHGNVSGLSGLNFTEGNRAIEKALFPPRLGEKFQTNLPDIFIIDETENVAVRKVIDSYNPENWVVCEAQNKQYNKGSKFYKLLMLWKIACQSSVEALMRRDASIEKIAWGLGWVFSDTAGAMCKSIEGGHALLLNPVDKDGKSSYNITDKKDLKKLMAYAKHEVAHIMMSYHDETFASVLTFIDSEFDERETFRKMKDFLAEIH